MRCSKGHEGSVVLDSRPTGVDDVRRRRQCMKCKERFTTYERKRGKVQPLLPASKEAFALMDKGGWSGKRAESEYERSLDRLEKYDSDGILISKKPSQPVRKVWL